MRNRYIPAFIMLIAGAITCFFDIYNKADLLTSLKRLFLVLIIFYIIGLIARSIVNKVLMAKPKTNEEETDGEVEDNSENKSEDSKADSSDGKNVENSENKEEDNNKELVK